MANQMPVILKALPQLVSRDRCRQMYEELQHCRMWNPGERNPQIACPKKHCYVDPPFRSLHEEMLPVAEDIAGRKLLPGTIFAQTYWRGATVRLHRYREEHWLTINILVQRDGDVPWPIVYRKNGQDHAFAREVGDAVAHAWGVPHRYDAQPGRINATEVLLHYRPGDL